MNKFIFENFYYDKPSRTAHFIYAFKDGQTFEEKVTFGEGGEYNETLLERALFLAFMVIGTSYYKCFPSTEVVVKPCLLDQGQAKFFTTVYQEGLSQFAYENNLKREDLVTFISDIDSHSGALDYKGEGTIALQSGGKDSLLLASMLDEKNIDYTPWYMLYSETHPMVLDKLKQQPRLVKRELDLSAIKNATAAGGRNGHVPITYIVMSFALIDAILHGENTILLAVGREGEEPTAYIDDLPVNHQWAKTQRAEQAFIGYVERYVSPDFRLGSPLRAYSELKIAELFAKYSWAKYGHEFSSCNLANYKQGHRNRQLKWDGGCSKCANAFLLFAPFVKPSELKSLFDGQDLFAKPSLQQAYKGLLGINGVMKPFECVGEIDELRLAYHMARKKWGNGYFKLPFDVPESSFDYKKTYDNQKWVIELLSPNTL